MGSSVLGTSEPQNPRATFATLYVGAILAVLLVPSSPRLFWTVLMPAIPIGFVLAGFHVWRRACPLAALASLSARGRPRRRLPRWIATRPLTTSLALLAFGLWVRLVATNGDAPALAVMLAVLGAAALIVNRVYSGKTWCNAFCPVGVVERIYTDAGALRATRDSRCTPCTGCVRACPDIDAERSYASSAGSSDRAFATYAFPGLVLGFYGYFRLRGGSWSAFFDGRWTDVPADRALFWGPGFELAPEVPAALAAASTLIAGATLSAILFGSIDALLARHFDPARVRHRMLAVAAFTALTLFYVFAGAPTLGLVPPLRRLVLVVVPAVAFIVLVRRFARVRASRAEPPARRKLPVVIG